MCVIHSWLVLILNFACSCLLHFLVLGWRYSKGNRREEATPRFQRGGAFQFLRPPILGVGEDKWWTRVGGSQKSMSRYVKESSLPGECSYSHVPGPSLFAQGQAGCR